MYGIRIKKKSNVQFNIVKKQHEKLNWMFSGTAQVSHQFCQFVLSVLCVFRWRSAHFNERKARLSLSHFGRLSALRWCHCCVGSLTEETVGFPEWTAQFSVWKTSRQDNSEACAIACQNCAVYSVFPSGMTSHSKIAQFNWKCTGLLTTRFKF
jgi:hypothetical protein